VGSSHQDLGTCTKTSLWITLTIRKVSDKSCRENQKIFYFLFFPENLTVYEIMWKNMMDPDRPQVTKVHYSASALLYSVTKATNTRSQNIKYLLLSEANVVKRTRLNVTLKVH